MLRQCYAGLAFSLLMTGAAMAQEAAQQQGELREKHGDWEVRCYGSEDCIMTQFHRRTEMTADAVFTIVRPKGLTDPEGNAIEALAEILVPLSVYLPSGLGLQIDGDAPRAAPYERCIPDGCLVRAPITPPVITQMLTGTSANIILSGSPTETVNVPMSLNGFAAAYAALEQ